MYDIAEVNSILTNWVVVANTEIVDALKARNLMISNEHYQLRLISLIDNYQLRRCYAKNLPNFSEQLLYKASKLNQLIGINGMTFNQAINYWSFMQPVNQIDLIVLLQLQQLIGNLLPADIYILITCFLFNCTERESYQFFAAVEKRLPKLTAKFNMVFFAQTKSTEPDEHVNDDTLIISYRC